MNWAEIKTSKKSIFRDHDISVNFINLVLILHFLLVLLLYSLLLVGHVMCFLNRHECVFVQLFIVHMIIWLCDLQNVSIRVILTQYPFILLYCVLCVDIELVFKFLLHTFQIIPILAHINSKMTCSMLNHSSDAPPLWPADLLFEG